MAQDTGRGGLQAEARLARPVTVGPWLLSPLSTLQVEGLVTESQWPCRRWPGHRGPGADEDHGLGRAGGRWEAVAPCLLGLVLLRPPRPAPQEWRSGSPQGSPCPAPRAARCRDQVHVGTGGGHPGQLQGPGLRSPSPRGELPRHSSRPQGGRAARSPRQPRELAGPLRAVFSLRTSAGPLLWLAGLCGGTGLGALPSLPGPFLAGLLSSAFPEHPCTSVPARTRLPGPRSPSSLSATVAFFLKSGDFPYLVFLREAAVQVDPGAHRGADSLRGLPSRSHSSFWTVASSPLASGLGTFLQRVGNF